MIGTENVGTTFRLGLCAIVAVVLGLAIPFWAVGLVVLPLAVLGEWIGGELARRDELTTLFALMHQGMDRRASACQWRTKVRARAAGPTRGRSGRGHASAARRPAMSSRPANRSRCTGRQRPHATCMAAIWLSSPPQLDDLPSLLYTSPPWR